MKKALDKFSVQSETYKKYRPQYPQELYSEILQFVAEKECCWDCGTGNGQVAVELSKHFKKVYATDLSKRQIANAEKYDNIVYSVGRAEKTNFKDNQFDLITIAQALHWFDFDAFNTEIKRVAKNGGIVSIWGYGLLRIAPNIDTIIDGFYNETMGAYWNRERKHIDNGYASIKFDFEKIYDDKNLMITVNWTLRQLEGYFNSWSSVHNYIKKNKGDNPVPTLMKRLGKHWSENSSKKVIFPIFIKISKIQK